jgi:hypothetical protein
LLGDFGSASVSHRLEQVNIGAVIVDVDEPVCTSTDQEIIVGEVHQRVNLDSLRGPAILLYFIVFIIVFYLAIIGKWRLQRRSIH